MFILMVNHRLLVPEFLNLILYTLNLKTSYSNVIWLLYMLLSPSEEYFQFPIQDMLGIKQLLDINYSKHSADVDLGDTPEDTIHKWKTSGTIWITLWNALLIV